MSNGVTTIDGQGQTGSAGLRTLGLFAGGFLSALTLLVSAFPFLDEILGLFPYVPEPPELARWVAAIMTFAVVGHIYLRTRRERKVTASTGAYWLLASIGLVLSYVYWGLDGQQPRVHDAFLVVLFALAHATGGIGFAKMSLFAYDLELRQRLEKSALSGASAKRPPTREEELAAAQQAEALRRSQEVSLEEAKLRLRAEELEAVVRKAREKREDAQVWIAVFWALLMTGFLFWLVV